ncbi:MAG: hypothetical protein UDB11_00005, partial [Peptococcaceae bacterium]|nr:hypothetical protein [Peptococcaceae bacterium]
MQTQPLTRSWTYRGAHGRRVSCSSNPMLGGKAQCLNCGQAKRFREENIWEGINLKKISKKIVSLVTLAA